MTYLPAYLFHQPFIPEAVVLGVTFETYPLPLLSHSDIIKPRLSEVHFTGSSNSTKSRNGDDCTSKDRFDGAGESILSMGNFLPRARQNWHKLGVIASKHLYLCQI